VATYDAWAGTFMDRKDWTGAIHVYDTALEQFPGNSHLEFNRGYCKRKAQKP
jgi:hypothetical protein